MSNSPNSSNTNFLKFALPSLAGAIIFLFPIPTEESFTIPFGILIDLVNENFADLITWLLLAVTVLSAAITVYFTSIRKEHTLTTLNEQVFDVAPVWMVLRVLGAIFCAMFTFGIGPEFIIGSATGGTVVGFLMKNLLALFFFAAIALPLLTDYGFMEFVGTFMSKAFRTLFRLPGRSAIDGLASWLGAAPIGVMLTVGQYKTGVYTRREAATVATTFSIVSIPFCYVIAKVVKLEHVFFAYYGSVILIGFVCALILSRIPPLSWMPDVIEGDPEGKKAPASAREIVQEGETSYAAGKRLALARAAEAPGVTGFLKQGGRNLIDIWFGLLPAALAIAMISLILAEYTPIFNWISAPFVPLLNAFNVAEAEAAAPAMVIGFADMYLPALIGANIVSEETRFLIAILSVSQLIYMSEVGALLLRAQIGLKFWHLITLFIMRTIIATPLALILAKLIF